MAVEAETLISAANFNTLQNRVARILGTGIDQTGYGQPVTSSPVPADSIIYASDMVKLLTDINAISIHQIGAPTSLAVVVPETPVLANEIEADDNDGFNQFITAVEVLESRLGIVDATQIGLETLSVDSRYDEWNGKITHSFTLTFPNADIRRNFFNAGGEIWISAELEGPSTPKNDNWKQMFTNTGVIKFGNTYTQVTGSGTLLPEEGVLGNFTITTSLTNIFLRTGAEGSTYEENYYRLYVRELSTKAIQFLVELEDVDSGDPNFDESVSGVLSSIVQCQRPVGSFVSIEAPAYSVQSSLEVGG